MAADTALRPGRVFAGHRIERLVAAGGMGAVYAAVDLRLERRVALKAITGEEARDDAFRERFIREARLLAGVDHPHVLPIYQAGEADGLLYLTMRLVAGRTLRELLRGRGLLSPGHAMRLLGPVAAALDELHARRVLHRDVKPENILLEGQEGDERVWLADFGLARQVDERSLTGTAERLGTFEYMAPEQWTDAAPVGPPADVYALALVLFETLTGTRPSILDRSPPPAPPLRSGPMSAGLHAEFRRALERTADRRHPSAGALVEAVRGTLPADPATATCMGYRAAPGTASGGDEPAYSLDFSSPPSGRQPPGHSAPGHSAPGHFGSGQQAPGQQPLVQLSPVRQPQVQQPAVQQSPVQQSDRRAGHPVANRAGNAASGPATTVSAQNDRRDGRDGRGGPGGPGGLRMRMPAWLWATAAAALVVAVAVPVLAFARRGGVPPDGTAAAPRPSVSVVTRTPSPSAEPSTARRARPTAGKRPGPQVAPARRAGPASTPAPAPPSAAPQVRQLPPQKYDICAQEASVRRDPLPEDQTRTVATMRRGDTFTVTAAKGNVWVYGQAGGSVSATGWAFRTYMQSGCS